MIKIENEAFTSYKDNEGNNTTYNFEIGGTPCEIKETKGYDVYRLIVDVLGKNFYFYQETDAVSGEIKETEMYTEFTKEDDNICECLEEYFCLDCFIEMKD